MFFGDNEEMGGEDKRGTGHRMPPSSAGDDLSGADGGALPERELPEGPAEVFARAQPILTELLGAGCFRLGGGTALAALWVHRHSTDVDLFADHAAYTEFIGSQSGVRLLSEGLRDALQPDEMEVRRGALRILCSGGELSIITTPSPLPSLAPTDRVAGTQVELERPATILARKLLGRMLTNGSIVLRDLYDLAAAKTLAPAELGLALDSVATDDKRQIADELRHLPGDWSASPRKSGRPVIRATRPPELARNPAQAVNVVRKLLAEDTSHRLRHRLSPDSPDP